jgi:hypothetical protein
MRELTLQQRKQVALATIGWLAVTAAVYAIASIGADAAQTPDERATAGLLYARDAMAEYRAKRGSYGDVTTERLRKIDSRVPAEMEDPVIFKNIFALTLTAPSGVTYRLGIGAGGKETRDCTVPTGAPPGECELGTGDQNVGTW